MFIAARMAERVISLKSTEICSCPFEDFLQVRRWLPSRSGSAAQHILSAFCACWATLDYLRFSAIT